MRFTLPMARPKRNVRTDIEYEYEDAASHEAILVEEDNAAAVRLKSSPFADVRVAQKDTKVHGAMLGAIETRVVETDRAFQPQTSLRHSDCDGVLKTQR